MGSAQPSFPVLSQSDFEKFCKMITSNFERMQSYSKVIITLGYGALLAIWSTTKPVLSERSLIWSGLLLVLSILAYVIFEVAQMIFYAWMSWKWADTTAKKGLLVALAEAEQREDRWRAPQWRSWFVTLVIAVLTGFGAAGILIYAFCRRLLRLG